MQRKRIDELIAVYRDGLPSDTLPFWIDRAVDHEWGGFTACLDRDGTVIDTDKGVWQQGRTAWLFGELYNNLAPKEEWLALTQHGIDFIERYCFDPADGRMWFHVTLPCCTIPIEAECSFCLDSHHPIISLQGSPSAVIVFRILHPILASTLCDANPLARIAGPKMIL
jgi:hypothetical protein